MANVVFKRGTGNLPATSEDGVLYFNEKTGRLALGIAGGKFVYFSDVVQMPGTSAPSAGDAVEGKIYIVEDKLFFKHGTEMVQAGSAAEVEALQDAIDILNGNDTTAGSVAKTVKDAVDALGTYKMEKLTTASAGASKSYKFYRVASDGTEDTTTSVTIDIPKDMVVSSGTVETYATAADLPTDANAPTTPGTYIVLVIANATSDKLYIPAYGLIEYVTSGSATGDDVVIAVSADHKVTATLSADVKASLAKADTALQQADIKAGSTAGTIVVGQKDDPDNAGQKIDNEIQVVDPADFDAAGDADAMGEKLYGEAIPATDALTLKGLAEKIAAGGTEWGTFDTVAP